MSDSYWSINIITIRPCHVIHIKVSFPLGSDSWHISESCSASLQQVIPGLNCFPDTHESWFTPLLLYLTNITQTSNRFNSNPVGFILHLFRIWHAPLYCSSPTSRWGTTQWTCCCPQPVGLVTSRVVWYLPSWTWMLRIIWRDMQREREPTINGLWCCHLAPHTTPVLPFVQENCGDSPTW